MSLILVVSLWLKGADVAAFEAFERQAAQVMSRHGGVIERAIRVTRTTPDSEEPFEIHVVRFPDEPSFAAYRADPETQQLAARRNEVIARTMVVAGYDVNTYLQSKI
jgi:uncharacterized protein (DUF1330 family)